MSHTSSREIHLASRPLGIPTSANFAVVDVHMPDPAPGQMLVRNLYLSVDPYMRGRMVDRKSYMPPFQMGEVMTGGAVVPRPLSIPLTSLTRAAKPFATTPSATNLSGATALAYTWPLRVNPSVASARG